MRIVRIMLCLGAAAIAFAQAPQQPAKKKLLAIGAVKGFQHDATSHGLAFQISAAYCAIVRSLENLPEPAMFRIAFRAQPSLSA